MDLTCKHLVALCLLYSNSKHNAAIYFFWGSSRSVQCIVHVHHCLTFFYWPLHCLSFDLRLLIRPKKKYVCLRSHVKKIQGWLVCINFFFFNYRQNQKQSFPVPESDSGISFTKFPVSCHLLKLFYDELCSFSTFFALNFDKKLAVE